MQTRMLINGELVAGQGAPIDVIDPASADADIAIRHVMVAHG